jgi:hypothetical protein
MWASPSAMTNSIQHAYESERGDGLRGSEDLKRWWMFSQERAGMLTVAFCDLGIGIPRSIQNPKQWDRGLVTSLLAQLGLSQPLESSLIRVALELSRSRTNLPHRGKGLPEILKAVREIPSGFLQIYSNQGSYRFRSKDQSERLHDFRDSIGGTMILWELEIASSQEQLTLDLVSE